MALHSALPYLESILPPELRAKLNSATTNPWSEPDPAIAAAIPFVNGATGELMAKIPMPSPKRVIRGKLRDLLRTGVEVRFGMGLTGIRVEDDGVVAVFDGEEVKGSVLVGADGGRVSSLFCWLMLTVSSAERGERTTRRCEGCGVAEAEHHGFGWCFPLSPVGSR